MNCMPIVSISLNDEILSELDKLQSSMGFSGRSEAIRAGIRTFVSEEKQNSDLSGNIHAILLVYTMMSLIILFQELLIILKT